MKISVSVVIPTLNRPEGVRKAVASALAGLPEDGEIIVVDDGSTVSAKIVLTDFDDPRLKCTENPGPHGPSAARNFGVGAARGDLILFLDDDDLLVHDYCRRVLDRMKDLPDDCVFGFSASYHLEADGSKSLHRSISPEGVLGEGTALRYRLAGLGMGFWITRQAFDAMGGLDTNIAVNEDTEFSIRLAANSYRCYCDQTPGVVLIHDPVRNAGDESSITKSATAKARFKGFEYILSKHRVFLLDHGAFRRKFLSRVIKYRVRAGEFNGWLEFCCNVRPISEAVVCGVLGTIWISLSKIVTRLTDPS